jgi:hypothetical protein
MSICHYDLISCTPFKDRGDCTSLQSLVINSTSREKLSQFLDISKGLNVRKVAYFTTIVNTCVDGLSFLGQLLLGLVVAVPPGLVAGGTGPPFSSPSSHVVGSSFGDSSRKLVPKHT